MTKIKKKLKNIINMPAEAKASLVFTLCSIMQKGIQLITVPIFTRLLTTEQYGQFSLYQSWLGIISILATLNLAAGVFNNGMLRFPNERDEYTSSMQGLSTMITIVLLVVYVLFVESWNSLLGLPTIVIVGMFLEFLFTPAYSFWSARQRYEYKYKALAIFTLIIAFANPIVGLIAVHMSDEKGVARILSVCLVNIVAGAFFYILNLNRGKLFYSVKYWKFALAFNLPLIPHYLSQIILAQSDRIMIERMFGETELALYSVAYSVGMIMSIVTTSVNASFVPWTYGTMKAGKYSQIGGISNGLMLLMGGIVLIPIIFAPEAIAILGAGQYMEAVWIIPPISISVFFTFLYSLFANIEFYYEKSKFVMIASVIAALTNVLLNIICMRKFGYVAAGYTTLVCYILLSILHYLFMKHICKLNHIIQNIYNDKQIIFIIFVLFIVTAIFMFLYKFTVLRYIVFGILMICIYVKKGYFLGIFKEIKNR